MKRFMSSQDSIQINRLSIAVSTVSFSSNADLMGELARDKHFDIHANPHGRRLDPVEFQSLLRGCEGAIVGLDQVNADLLENCPDLRVVSKYGVGLDNIDFEACRKHGVEVYSTQGINKTSVAEQTLGFMLMLCRNLSRSGWNLKHGKWIKEGGIQLSGKSVGIIGVGNIGKELIRLLKPFQCRILVNDILDQNSYYQSTGVEEVGKQQLFEEADLVTLHVPLTSDTANLVNKEVFETMKSSAFLINTARGGIVEESDLKWALENAQIGGAALDVFEIEPPEDRELIEHENFLCTPHIGGNAKEAVAAMGFAAIENLRNFFSSKGSL